MSGREVPREWLERATRIRDLSGSTADEVRRVLEDDPEIADWRPEAGVAVDPRNGVRVVYSMARARRPHDHPPSPPPPVDDCIVCAGRTTEIVDIAPLSRGFTFMNTNLFPVVYPDGARTYPEVRGDATAGRAAGTHLLQWVSTEHDVDLHNMEPTDLAVVLSRLAAMEDCFYRTDGSMPEVAEGQRGHVLVVKNVGRLVGGSIEHGHQQIIHTNVRPRVLGLDAAFAKRTGEAFRRMILRDNPSDLTVREYGGRFRTIVPWFMHRPLEMMIVAESEGVRDLRDMDDQATLALAQALRDAAEAVTALMPEMGREVAWNLAVHNGIAGGLYVEMLPYTQERGGYEALGLNLCEGSPADTAQRVRAFLEGTGR